MDITRRLKGAFGKVEETEIKPENGPYRKHDTDKEDVDGVEVVEESDDRSWFDYN